MNGEYNFKKDLAKGETGEDEIIAYMQGLGFQFINRNNDNRYDITMGYGGNSYTYEIKTDIYPRDTGNLAIEVECRGKESGLSITQADFFVYYFPHLGEIWNIRTEHLRNIIKQNTEIKFVEGAGDPGSNTKLYLIKKNHFKNHFKVHKV